MKVILLPRAMAFVPAFLLALAQAAPAQSVATTATPPGISAQSSNGIVAVVGGRPILKSEQDEKIALQEMQIRATASNKEEMEKELAELRAKARDSLIEQELILKEFEPFAAGASDKVKSLTDEHIRTTIIKEIYKGERPQLLKALSSQGLSYKRFYEMQREGVIVSIMRGQNTRDVGYVTSEEKDAYLAAHGEDFRDGDQIKLWSITIPKVGEAIGAVPASQLALAKEIRSKLLRGDNFATLAKAYSQDLKSGNGGDWGFITKKDFTRSLADMVFALPVRKVSDLVDANDSYFIFYVDARIPGKMKPKEEVDAEVERRVLMEKRKKSYDAWIARLKNKTTIKLYDR